MQSPGKTTFIESAQYQTQRLPEVSALFGFDPQVSDKRFRPFPSSAPIYENVSFCQYFFFISL